MSPMPIFTYARLHLHTLAFVMILNNSLAQNTFFVVHNQNLLHHQLLYGWGLGLLSGAVRLGFFYQMRLVVKQRKLAHCIV